jgi:hypothetical protein
MRRSSAKLGLQRRIHRSVPPPAREDRSGSWAAMTRSFLQDIVGQTLLALVAQLIGQCERPMRITAFRGSAERVDGPVVVAEIAQRIPEAQPRLLNAENGCRAVCVGSFTKTTERRQ